MARGGRRVGRAAVRTLVEVRAPLVGGLIVELAAGVNGVRIDGVDADVPHPDGACRRSGQSRPVPGEAAVGGVHDSEAELGGDVVGVGADHVELVHAAGAETAHNRAEREVRGVDVSDLGPVGSAVGRVVDPGKAAHHRGDVGIGRVGDDTDHGAAFRSQHFPGLGREPGARGNLVVAVHGVAVAAGRLRVLVLADRPAWALGRLRDRRRHRDQKNGRKERRDQRGPSIKLLHAILLNDRHTKTWARDSCRNMCQTKTSND